MTLEKEGTSPFGMATEANEVQRSVAFIMSTSS